MSQHLFNRSAEYDAMLQKGLSLTGEDKHYYIRGRIRELRKRLPPGFSPQSIMDFGCGIGDTTQYLAEVFPNSEIVGLDTSEGAISHAQQRFTSDRISFRHTQGIQDLERFDLCYTNGVLHHVAPDARLTVLQSIHDALQPGGYFALFENNPWNPGTRLVMRMIPFDRDAQPLNSAAATGLLREGKFNHCSPPRYLFYFPRMLRFLRFVEKWLTRFPLGGQYFILAQK